jgi:hypothetical protein
MGTKKLLGHIARAAALAMLSSPLAVPPPAKALPPGVPKDRCGTLRNPKPGTLCYSVTPGGGKVNAGGQGKDFPAIIIQATEPEYVIADVILEITSSAGDRNLPSINQLSPGGEASVVRESRQKQRDLKQTTAELQAKATVLSGPALIEAQAKIRSLQEQERIYESVVRDAIAAGQDAGKFQVSGASARSRKCGWGNLDTCGSWVEYNVYAVKRYVGDPIAAYNRASAVAQDARNTITRLVAQNQQTPPNPPPFVQPKTCFSVDSRQGWQSFTANHRVSGINYIEGGWSVDSRSYPMVSYTGHQGTDAERLAPFNAYKYNQSFPFGALLMELPNGDVIWANQPGGELGSFPEGSSFRFRINDADAALGDNGGSLKVCLVYGVG